MAERVQENKMGVMPVKKLLINMSLPMMISMFVQAMYNIVDSIFVARISENALTAVSLAFPMQSIMIAVAAGTGVGVNALVSRALGAKEYDHANRIAVNGLFIYFLSYLLMLVLGFTIVRPFFSMQTNAEQTEIFELGTTYLTICLTMSFGIYGQFIFERLLQSTGRTFLTMLTQGIGAVIDDSVFLGLNTHYFVTTDSGLKAEIVQESQIDSIIPKGERVRLTVKQEKINVMTADGSANILSGVQNDLETGAV